ncbi:hypothetical protein C2845_PM07G39720 [Panicum miliaceum]|uniref:DUF1618 domain-containing protein n=1 Tax=Panicum miliaceum TaxID=4540 RepID=A0A3L6SPM7_PANMI|nr:hypothetical protein C2845_PM07G39720 [Panicum miliaceum]
MSSAPPEAAKSSRVCKQPEEPSSDEEPQRRGWVALATLTGGPHRAGDQRHRSILPGRDLLLDLHDPPRASTLVLRDNLTSFLPTILVADSSSGRLLVKSAWGSARVNRPEYFLCDASARTAMRLPAVPSAELGGPNACPLGGLDLCPRRSIGLIADPDRTGHFMIAQLHPAPTTRHEFILFYSTATRRWATKQLASAPEHKRWGGHGVLVHEGLLWWVDVAYGMLVCNVFDDAPDLYRVPLPDGCALQGVEADRNDFQAWQRTRELLDQRRFIRPSEGRLRYVEIRGFNYDTAATAAEPPNDPTLWMWTLVDLLGPNPDTWELEYEVPFAEIWAHDSYVAAGLPPYKVPNLALVDPDNHGVVYFFQGTRLFGLDVRARRVVACDECVIGDGHQMQEGYLSSRFVEAWVPPEPDRTPQVLRYNEEKDRRVTGYVEDWLSQTEWTSQADEGSSSGEPIQGMAPPSEASPDAGHQADEP